MTRERISTRPVENLTDQYIFASSVCGRDLVKARLTLSSISTINTTSVVRLRPMIKILVADSSDSRGAVDDLQLI